MAAPAARRGAVKFVLHSDCGDAVFLGRRLAREGHDVGVYIRDPPSRRVYDGLLRKLPGPVVPDGTDCVIFDAPGSGTLGAALRRRGIGVIGGNPFDAVLELDREAGVDLMHHAGIETPETHHFSGVVAAKAFLVSHPGTWFFKTDDRANTDMTRSGSSRALVRFLAWAALHVPTAVRSFVLQRAVDGTEVSLEGWFDGTRWIPPFNSTLETKRIVEGVKGDIGPRVGCAANVVWTWADGVPDIAARTLVKITPTLRQHRYVGPIDLNLLIGPDGEPHGLEWTPRLGFDAVQAWSMLVQGNLGEQLCRFAKGQLARFDCRTDVVALTVRVGLGSWLAADADAAAPWRGLPLDPAVLDRPEDTFPDDVCLDREGLPACAGRDGGIVVVGGIGHDYLRLVRDVVRRADALDIPSRVYRRDAVADAPTRWQALADVGLMSGDDAPARTGLDFTSGGGGSGDGDGAGGDGADGFDVPPADDPDAPVAVEIEQT